MTVATQQPSIFKLFYTHRRTQILLEAKGIKVRNIEKVSINKPSGEFYSCVHVVYIVKNGGRCSTSISCKEYLQRAIYPSDEDGFIAQLWKIDCLACRLMGKHTTHITINAKQLPHASLREEQR